MCPDSGQCWPTLTQPWSISRPVLVSRTFRTRCAPGCGAACSPLPCWERRRGQGVAGAHSARSIGTKETGTGPQRFRHAQSNCTCVLMCSDIVICFVLVGSRRPRCTQFRGELHPSTRLHTDECRRMLASFTRLGTTLVDIQQLWDGFR